MYCQGDMFRPLLGHLQAIWENRSKNYLYLNALWDPKCLQIVFHVHRTQSGSIWDPTVHWDIDSSWICFPRGPEDDLIKVETCCPGNMLFLYIKLCISHSCTSLFILCVSKLMLPAHRPNLPTCPVLHKIFNRYNLVDGTLVLPKAISGRFGKTGNQIQCSPLRRIPYAINRRRFGRNRRRTLAQLFESLRCHKTGGSGFDSV